MSALDDERLIHLVDVVMAMGERQAIAELRDGELTELLIRARIVETMHHLAVTLRGPVKS